MNTQKLFLFISFFIIVALLFGGCGKNSTVLGADTPTAEVKPTATLPPSDLLSESVIEPSPDSPEVIWAAFQGDQALIDQLLIEGVDAEVTDDRGFTPLHWAAWQGHDSIVSDLLEYGVNIDPKITTFTMEVSDPSGTLSPLVDTGFFYNAHPLHFAAFRGYSNIVNDLLDHGADPDSENGYGDRPIFVAAYEGHYDIVEFLLAAGADVNAMNNDGVTALEFIANTDHEEIKQLLEQHSKAQTLPTETPIPSTETSQHTTDTQETEMTEMTLQVQSQGGSPAAEGGITLSPGESISFDAAGRPEGGLAGFWRSIDDAKYTVLFLDQDGQVLALVELQGLVRWDKESNLVEGEGSFLRIQVESGVWLDIVDRNLNNGQLSLTDENGDQYVVMEFGALFEGIMTRK